MTNKLFIELNNLMIKHRFKPKKKFSQNFLINQAMIEKIVSFAELDKKDTVLEIGAGTGFLTKELLSHCKIIAVEIDSFLNDALEEKFEKELKEKKLELIKEDFLKAEIPSFNKVVSLPPYRISTPILFRLMNEKLDFALLVFQKDYAVKLLSEPGFSEYTSSVVLVNYFFEPEILIESVQASSFFPLPRTESALIKFTSKKRFGKAKNDKKFIKFIKEVFRFKNKNLQNALQKAFPFIEKEMNLNKTILQELIKSGKFSELLNEKVMLLEISELVELFNELMKKH
ncbi:MAG: 16S rRNA (adenine(1518)-N(6)/adenine(1519)-N(6))-dimethyltransferase RsmA [Candidatus Diapherotrites archaeon]